MRFQSSGSLLTSKRLWNQASDIAFSNLLFIKKLNSGTEEEPQEPASVGYVNDLQEESKVLEQFGCGFGEEESYRVFKSLSVQLRLLRDLLWRRMQNLWNYLERY